MEGLQGSPSGQVDRAPADWGTFTPWGDMPSDPDMLFYEGLHGAIVTENVNVAQYVDLLIGVVPVINLSGFKSFISTIPDPL